MDNDLRAFSVAEAAAMLSLSVVQMRRLIAREEVRVKRAGRRILVPASAIREYLEEVK